MLTQDIMTAIGHELLFWKSFVKTDRFLKGWVAADIKTPELQQEIYDFLTSFPDYREKKVLDVGSGAVSILNGTFPEENITTVDPLGALYPVIFDYEAYGIRAPIPCGGKNMNFSNKFDIVHCSNAIDHSQNPLAVYKNMHHACRDGGIVVLQSFTDEAINQNWEGFHQFNFNISQNGNIIYTDQKNNCVKLGGEQVFYCIKKNHLPGRDFFMSAWRKNAS
jgi:SAM-dependent methyltransferase